MVLIQVEDELVQPMANQPDEISLKIFGCCAPACDAEAFDHAVAVAKLLGGRSNLSGKEMSRRISLERVDPRKAEMLKHLVA